MYLGPVNGDGVVTFDIANLIVTAIAGGAYAVDTLGVATDEGSSRVIYVKSTNTVEFFRVNVE